MLLIGVFFFAFCACAEEQPHPEGKFEPTDFVSPALREGVIGLSTFSMKLLGSIHIPSMANTGCRWMSSAPFCTAKCDSDQTRYRTTAELVDGEDGYGSSCWTGEKSFCCRHNWQDKTWYGLWQSTKTGIVHYCSFYAKNSSMDQTFLKCGEFRCQFSRRNINEHDMSEISGESCNEVHLFGKTGNARPGMISWKAQKHGKELADVWYKL